MSVSSIHMNTQYYNVILERTTLLYSPFWLTCLFYQNQKQSDIQFTNWTFLTYSKACKDQTVWFITAFKPHDKFLLYLKLINT